MPEPWCSAEARLSEEGASATAPQRLHYDILTKSGRSHSADRQNPNTHSDLRMDPLRGGIAFGAAFLAGAINSVAGGGTLISFPALIWLGLNSVGANATSTVAIWPGTVGSAWGYRRELAAAETRFRILIVPSLIGGITGALLLRWTPPAFFDRLVPFLILFATLLFIAQETVQRLLKTSDSAAHK